MTLPMLYGEYESSNNRHGYYYYHNHYYCNFNSVATHLLYPTVTLLWCWNPNESIYDFYMQL